MMIKMIKIKINTNINSTNFNNKFKIFKYYSTSEHNKNLLEEFIKEKELKPTHIYEDLHLDTVRKKLLTDTKGLSGIYLIFNKINGHFYIGSASTNKLNARFSNHLIYLKGSKVLKLAVRKYGLSNFAFLILELFPEIVNKENNKDFLDIEDFYLKSLLPDYHILTEAGNSFGYKHTELDRIKMKSSYSIERSEKIGNLNRGKKLSSETIEKIRKGALNKKIISFTDQ